MQVRRCDCGFSAMMYITEKQEEEAVKRKRCKKPAVNQNLKRLVDVALSPNDSDSLLAEVCCVDNCDSKMAYYRLKLLQGIALFAQLAGTYSQIFQLKTDSLFSIVFEVLFYCSSVWRRSGLTLRIRRSGFDPWPVSLCCVLGQDTLLSQCLFPPRCMNEYRRI